MEQRMTRRPYRLPASAVLLLDSAIIPALIFAAASGVAAAAGHITVMTAAAALTCLSAWLTTRHLRKLTGQPFTTARRAVQDAARRFGSNTGWYVRDDLVFLYCHHRLAGYLRISRVTAEDLQAVGDNGAGFVMATTFRVRPFMVRVERDVSAVRMTANGNTYPAASARPASYLRRYVQFARMTRTGATYAECGELDELTRQIRAAEPDYDPGT
jgi:hypothetical protein